MSYKRKFRVWSYQEDRYLGDEELRNFLVGADGNCYTIDWQTQETKKIPISFKVEFFTGNISRDKQEIYENDLLEHPHSKKVLNQCLVSAPGICYHRGSSMLSDKP